MISQREWDTAWTKISESLGMVQVAVLAARPQSRITVNRSQTAHFPFGATLSISRDGIPGEEDLVIAIDGHLREDHIRMSIDISRGNGYVLADGPDLSINLDETAANLTAMLDRWTEHLAAFLEQQIPMAINELAGQPESSDQHSNC